MSKDQLSYAMKKVKAYNSTYANGINPEAVKEMYDAIILFVDCYGVEEGWVSDDIFNKAQAAIKKAKLI